MSLVNRLRSALRPAPPPAPEPRPAPQRPSPPKGAFSHVILILDSCRFDSFLEAKPKNMMRLGELERRYTYATWTAPSHYNLLIGLLPHPSPKQVYASEYYKDDFLKFRERLNFDLDFGKMVPGLWLPQYLRDVQGYHTSMFVSMPVLNPSTPINRGFDRYQLMPKHNDLRPMIRQMRFYQDRPGFYVLNTGETHYPYATPDEAENDYPRIHGVNGVFKHLDDHLRAGKLVHDKDRWFDEAKMEELRQRQIQAVRWVDGVIEELYDLVPDNTWITITGDHGDLFGEDGYFGHGPISHEKVMEVPFVEGRLK